MSRQHRSRSVVAGQLACAVCVHAAAAVCAGNTAKTAKAAGHDPSEAAGWFNRPAAHILTMNINFTKKPMKPMTTKPIAVLEQILLNSVWQGRQGTAGRAGQQAVQPTAVSLA